MQELLEWMEYIEDKRQQRKVRHTLKDILVIVLFATLANADDWVETDLFAEDYQDYLRKYIELKNGPPSHDTIRRVMGMISPEILQQLYTKWQERLNRNEGELDVYKRQAQLLGSLFYTHNSFPGKRNIIFMVEHHRNRSLGNTCQLCHLG